MKSLGKIPDFIPGSGETYTQMRDFLDEQSERYNVREFIAPDPISIPHRFSRLQDIEISAFLVATISWGNRKSILNSAVRMLDRMDHAPYDFVQNAQDSDLKMLKKTAVHRTFSGEDFVIFILNLQRLYHRQKSLEPYFLPLEGEENFYHALERFRTRFLADPAHRSAKHVSSTYRNSAAKRLMMFLRWMVRQDRRGVDFGLWKKLRQEHLSVPLDVHSAGIARYLGLLQRKQNDWKAVEELDTVLRSFDAADPAKYDFALFGLGVSGSLKTNNDATERT